MENSKIKALAEFLEVEENEINQSSYDENTFEYGNQEYRVLTDEEADEATKEYISDSVWAFNANFILDHAGINWNNRIEKSLQKVQTELCEDANELLKAMVKDIDEFVQDAIDADGRGHFLAGYDSEENEQDEYFIYRNN
jgi:hypothetical protein